MRRMVGVSLGVKAGVLHSPSRRGWGMAAMWIPEWELGQRRKLGETQLAGVCGYENLWVKNQWRNSAGSPWHLCWSLVSSVMKAAGVLCWEGKATAITPSVWLMLVAHVLLPCSQLSEYCTALLVAGWGEADAGPSCKAWKAPEGLIQRLWLSQAGTLFLAGTFPLGLLALSSAGLGAWGRYNEAVFPSLFVWLFSGFVFPPDVEVS